jgi:hypothetical protein
MHACTLRHIALNIGAGLVLMRGRTGPSRRRCEGYENQANSPSRNSLSKGVVLNRHLSCDHCFGLEADL